MRSKFLLLVCFFSVCFLMSCKSDVEKQENATATDTVIEKKPIVKKNVPKPAEKKPLTEMDKKQLASVLLQLMYQENLKTYTGVLVSSGLTDMLGKEDGPFTIFAPTNEAFEALTDDERKKHIYSASNQEHQAFINRHIVTEYLDAATLRLKINENGGSYTMNTLANQNLTARIVSRDVIEISDVKGNTYKVKAEDFKADNGVVHSISNVIL